MQIDRSMLEGWEIEKEGTRTVSDVYLAASVCGNQCDGVEMLWKGACEMLHIGL